MHLWLMLSAYHKPETIWLLRHCGVGWWLQNCRRFISLIELPLEKERLACKNRARAFPREDQAVAGSAQGLWSQNFRRNKRSHYSIFGSDHPKPMTRFRLKSRPIFPGVSRARAGQSYPYESDKGRHEHVSTLCPDVGGGPRAKMLWPELPGRSLPACVAANALSSTLEQESRCGSKRQQKLWSDPIRDGWFRMAGTSDSSAVCGAKASVVPRRRRRFTRF